MAETTHLVCAHCGQSSSISNRNMYASGTEVAPLPDTLVFSRLHNMLHFTCQHCQASYRLPVVVIGEGDR